jgi:hypothetical protein
MTSKEEMMMAVIFAGLLSNRNCIEMSVILLSISENSQNNGIRTLDNFFDIHKQKFHHFFLSNLIGAY